MNSVVIKTLLFFSFFSVLFFSTSTPVFADNDTEGALCTLSISGTPISLNSSSRPDVKPTSASGQQRTFQIRACGDTSIADTLPDGWRAAVGVEYSIWSWYNAPLTKDGECLFGTITFTLDTPQNIVLDIEGNNGTPICRRGYAHALIQTEDTSAAWEAAKTQLCNSVVLDPPTGWVSGSNLTVQYDVPEAYWGNVFTGPSGYSYHLVYEFLRGTEVIFSDQYASPSTGGSLVDPRQYQMHNNLTTANYTLKFALVGGSSGNERVDFCSRGINVGTPADPGEETKPDLPEAFSLCKQAGNNEGKCESCLVNNGIWTAIGCIPYGVTAGGEISAVPTIRAFISIGLGIAGGVVVIMVLVGAFLLSTSQGDLKRVDEGKALITSAVIGLLFVIFSVTILRFIGFDLLRLPGFGGIR